MGLGRVKATETKPGTSVVFLSYASADRERALRVTSLLEAGVRGARRRLFGGRFELAA